MTHWSVRLSSLAVMSVLQQPWVERFVVRPEISTPEQPTLAPQDFSKLGHSPLSKMLPIVNITFELKIIHKPLLKGQIMNLVDHKFQLKSGNCFTFVSLTLG